MIDIHNHILPGLDDGPAFIEESIEMARIAAESGVTAIVATPHCNVPGSFENYYSEEYQNCFNDVKKALKEEEIKIELYPGMEVYATFDLPQLLQDGKIMTLNRSRYLLVEFKFTEDPDFVERILKQVREKGAVPIIAHAERYQFIQDQPQRAYDWMIDGCGIQINKSSFKGSFGHASRKAAYKLMDHHLVSVIASDAHGEAERTPDMSGIFKGLSGDYEKNYAGEIFFENPKLICENQPLIKRKPRSFF